MTHWFCAEACLRLLVCPGNLYASSRSAPKMKSHFGGTSHWLNSLGPGRFGAASMFHSVEKALGRVSSQRSFVAQSGSWGCDGLKGPSPNLQHACHTTGPLVLDATMSHTSVGFIDKIEQSKKAKKG